MRVCGLRLALAGSPRHRRRGHPERADRPDRHRARPPGRASVRHAGRARRDRAPITVGSLAALVGLFAVLDSRDGDRRAALAGLRTGALLTARLGVLAAAALAATAVSLTATALVFHALRWPTYAAANVLIAFTYALIGALLAPV